MPTFNYIETDWLYPRGLLLTNVALASTLTAKSFHNWDALIDTGADISYFPQEHFNSELDEWEVELVVWSPNAGPIPLLVGRLSHPAFAQEFILRFLLVNFTAKGLIRGHERYFVLGREFLNQFSLSIGPSQWSMEPITDTGQLPVKPGSTGQGPPGSVR